MVHGTVLDVAGPRHSTAWKQRLIYHAYREHGAVLDDAARRHSKRSAPRGQTKRHGGGTQRDDGGDPLCRSPLHGGHHQQQLDQVVVHWLLPALDDVHVCFIFFCVRIRLFGAARTEEEKKESQGESREE